jgi:uncharacterized protein involved in exopolysaccharide biosynthesis
MTQSQQLLITPILAKIKSYWEEIWSRKWWVILSAILLSGAMLTSAWFTPKNYVAPLTFMVDSEKGSPLGGVTSMLGQFGLGGGGGGQNYEKIRELALSRMILTDVIKTEVSINDRHDFLGNHILDIYGLKVSEDSDIASNFRFENLDSGQTVKGEAQAILKLSKFIRGNPQKGVEGLLSVGFDDESTVLYIKAKTLEQELSTRLAEVEYDVLSKFYIYNTTKKQKTTYKQLELKVDSIKEELHVAEAALSKFRDLSGIILHQNKLPRDQLARKVEVLYIMYGEALKNKETADFLLKNATPYFQVIDYPVGPYQPVGKSRLKSLIIGGIWGVLLAFVIIIGRFWFIEQLQEEKLQS